MIGRKYDFVAIGDIVTDAFIKLKDARVRCDARGENCMLAMRFGDKIPYENMVVVPAVGNSANAAVAAARLGLKSALVSQIGGDQNGKDALKVLREEKVGTKFIKVNKRIKTNYHYVLSYKGERTILIKHEKFSNSLPSIGKPSWLYLSSSGEHGLMKYHREIEKYLASHPNIKLAFQPGTYQIQLGRKLVNTYKRAEVVFVNKEEAQKILDRKEEDIKKLLDGITSLGPKITVVTDGRKGAYMRDEKGYWHMPIYPDMKPPVERTGAGDAFSSTFVAALALGKSSKEALAWGPINSMYVTQYVGAREGLLPRHTLVKLLNKAPKTYRVRKI